MGEFRKCKGGQYSPVARERGPGCSSSWATPKKTGAGSGSVLSHLLAS